MSYSDDDMTQAELERILDLSRDLKLEATLIESEPCTACNGSGRYDSNGSPACEACSGCGKQPVSENAVRRLSEDLSTLNILDWREASAVSAKIQEHMDSIGLGWEDKYYWG